MRYEHERIAFVPIGRDMGSVETLGSCAARVLADLTATIEAVKAGHVVLAIDGPHTPGGIESLILDRVVGVLTPAVTEMAHG